MSPDELEQLNAYWRAANYLSVGQIYLLDNPLLKEPLQLNDHGAAPDVVMACAGDVPPLETLAAVSILREQLPALKVRVVNVVDLMTLQPKEEHPHGLADRDFDRVPSLGYVAAHTKQLLGDKLIEHRQYINEHGEDMPEIREWRWSNDTDG